MHLGALQILRQWLGSLRESGGARSENSLWADLPNLHVTLHGEPLKGVRRRHSTRAGCSEISPTGMGRLGWSGSETRKPVRRPLGHLQSEEKECSPAEGSGSRKERVRKEALRSQNPRGFGSRWKNPMDGFTGYNIRTVEEGFLTCVLGDDCTIYPGSSTRGRA